MQTDRTTAPKPAQIDCGIRSDEKPPSHSRWSNSESLLLGLWKHRDAYKITCGGVRVCQGPSAGFSEQSNLKVSLRYQLGPPIWLSLRKHDVTIPQSIMFLDRR